MAIARALLEGAVYARLDKADDDVQRQVRASRPNFFLPFDRAGIDPFTDRFPIVLRLEGTVRGTGGFASLTTVVRPTYRGSMPQAAQRRAS
ncbi:hypothetical protein [Bradyrhizobium cosmicum]|uniref:hypothetical protein n=1 Tax=Bradyrhizobium cosmicum TaxID=1404864 RepID=UPI0028F0B51E|nr:hypothetical protein [Bradyrhizobium cosmicum]